MQCEDVMAKLTAYSSGSLPPDNFRIMQAHIADCPACRAALAKVDALAGILSDAQTPPVPSDFASRVVMSARRRQKAGSAANWSLRSWWRLTSPAMHVAAAAVLIVGLSMGLMMGWTAGTTIRHGSGNILSDHIDVYRFDHLSETSEGSLGGNYLTLASGADGKGS